MTAVAKCVPTPYCLWWRLFLTYRTLLGKLLLPVGTIVVLLVITAHRYDNDSARSAPGMYTVLHVILLQTHRLT